MKHTDASNGSIIHVQSAIPVQAGQPSSTSQPLGSAIWPKPSAWRYDLDYIVGVLFLTIRAFLRATVLTPVEREKLFCRELWSKLLRKNAANLAPCYIPSKQPKTL